MAARNLWSALLASKEALRSSVEPWFVSRDISLSTPYARRLSDPARYWTRLAHKAEYHLTRARYKQLTTPWTPGIVPGGAGPLLRSLDADVINLHWTNAGFLSVSQIAEIERPLVLTLHDSWAFTGGCHIPLTCERFLDRCGACPQLGAHKENDLSRKGWSRKFDAWRRLKSPIVVCPSAWLAKSFERSSLSMGRKAVVIANALDAEFHAQAKSPPHRESRRGPCTIGFVAAGALSNRNKGFQDLAGALSHLSLEKRQAIRLLIVGDVGHDSIPRIEGVEIHTIGSLQQRAKMIEAYLQMDCCVVPSHSENLPNVIVEAMCLGIPTIATNVGGIPELITDHETGFLAAPSNPESLARALDYFLSYGDVNELASRARKYALSKTSPEIVAAQYLDVYATAQQTYWSGAPQRSGARSTQV